MRGGLTAKERKFVEMHEGVDLAAAVLSEADPEGPAHQAFDRHTTLRLRSYHWAENSLHRSQVRRETWARRKEFLLGLPVIRRLVKR